MKRIFTTVYFLGILSGIAQNRDFSVYSYTFESTDSSLHRLYRCEADGDIIWEKFFYEPGITEECNYRYGGGRLLSKTCCFRRDSCFTWNFVYEDDNILLSRVIAYPAFPDSVKYSETETRSYPDSLTTIRFRERKGIEPMVLRVKEKKLGNVLESTGFDESGKAIFTEKSITDQFGITESVRDIPGKPELVLRFRRFAVIRK